MVSPSHARWLQPGLLAIGGCALVVMIHCFALPLLPERYVSIPNSSIQPETPGAVSHAFAVPFLPDAGESPNDRCLVTLSESGSQLSTLHADVAAVRNGGQGLYLLERGRLIFSTSDNTDPRTNGRDYDASYPLFYSRAIGYAAAAIFLLATAALYLLPRAQPTAVLPAKPSPSSRFRVHLIAAAIVLLLGLYCSTGTLSPYANNGSAFPVAPYGYLYNPDHVHFKVLFQFVDGQGHSAWDGALFLRRILFPVLAYPFMKLWGFEIGGAIASLALNVAGLVAFLLILRRMIGERAAIFAAWLLALYPGAAYWGGLPYPYSTIFPFSLLLMTGLLALEQAGPLRRVALISLLMGVAYLGYDLVVYFLPASVLVLLWRRRWLAAGVAGAVQALPLFAWLLILRHGLHQSLANSNSAAFGLVLDSYLHLGNYTHWWHIVREAPAIGLNVLFGSNFAFLPALFVLVLAINAVTARIRFHPAEAALLGVTAGLFLFNNLAPAYFGPWELRGTWVARLYQPCFPALVLFLARWFQALPPLARPARIGLGGAFLACSLGNALIIFGPILDNPGRISERAFFAFADSRVSHTLYEANLERYGRRPLGFADRPE